MYGSGVKLIVGGTNGSNIGTNAEEGFALKPDFSERATWLYLTVSAAPNPTPYPLPLPPIPDPAPTPNPARNSDLHPTPNQWATACFFLLSFLFHLGNALLWRKPYLRLLASGYTEP